MPRTKKLAHKRAGRKPTNSTTSYRILFTPSLPSTSGSNSALTHLTRSCPLFRNSMLILHGKDSKLSTFAGYRCRLMLTTINQFYSLAGGETSHTEYVTNISAEQLKCALINVCMADTEWTVSAQGKLTVPRATLTPQCKVWYHFLKNRLMPSTHIQTVSQGRVLLLDSIISGRSIDVGAIIFQELGSCAAKKCGSLRLPSLITSLGVNNGVPIFNNEERLLSAKEAITKVSIARLLHTKLSGSSSNPFPNEEEEAGQVPPEPTKRTATASTSQGSIPANLAHSLQLLEQRMSQTEVQQFQMMEMMQQMHSQQQAFWTYTKHRDVALKKSSQKNFTKPIFPFPEFPDDVLARPADDDIADDVDRESDDA